VVPGKLAGAAEEPRRTDIRRMKVMISSRCNDPFPRAGGESLTIVRQRLKDELQAAELFGQRLFQVWINEDAPPADGDDGWDACMKQVDDADVIVVLYNGNAGWTANSSGVGICHGELKRALDMAPAKVRLIQLGSEEDVKSPKGPSNDRFRTFIQAQGLFRGSAKTATELLAVAKQTVLHAFADLVGGGLREARKGRFYTGDALEWSKLDYIRRQAAIKGALLDYLVGMGATHLRDDLVSHPMSGAKMLLVLNAIPAALTVSAAREMVGRPFLRDHLLLPSLAGGVGPVHLIGCNRGATESQALQLLGFPDAIVVTAPFGIYVADDIQKVQFVLLSNCRDETSTRHALQRFTEWLDVAGEANDLIERARSRKRIVQAIAKENSIAGT
jgi:hypothetical protein